jgi:hypothetical protein
MDSFVFRGGQMSIRIHGQQGQVQERLLLLFSEVFDVHGVKKMPCAMPLIINIQPLLCRGDVGYLKTIK